MLEPAFHDAIERIPAADWNALDGARWPFLRHEFLSAAERHECVSPETGWTPCHLTLRDAGGRLAAAMPLYEKTHSWGEFVFDWGWADAYRRAGLDYYPKLVCTAPFTPATSPRLLVAAGEDRPALERRLLEAALERARERRLSSLHLLFPSADEAGRAEAAGLMLRKDCQFHWRNRGYRDFDEFLATFSSAKRKKVRRERRRVREADIGFRVLDGDSMTPSLWETAHHFCSNTFLRRGHSPYLNLGFFLELGERLPGALRVVLAEHRGRPIAAAVCFQGEDTLYGRYWGSEADYHSLHFETCYYQGIEHCIREGLEAFEPGTQGEHKISRGFSPVTTWSAHWLAHPQFADAVGDYLERESVHVERYIEAVREHLPYRSGE